MQSNFVIVTRNGKKVLNYFFAELLLFRLMNPKQAQP